MGYSLRWQMSDWVPLDPRQKHRVSEEVWPLDAQHAWPTGKWMHPGACKPNPQLSVNSKWYSGLSALLHAKTATNWSEQKRSPADQTITKVVSASVVDRIRTWTWHLEVLDIHCSLEVSSCNGPSCYWIKTPKAERVGFSHYNFFPHRSIMQFTFNTRPTSLGAWGSNRWRWPLGFVVTNLHIGNPWASGHSIPESSQVKSSLFT